MKSRSGSLLIQGWGGTEIVPQMKTEIKEPPPLEDILSQDDKTWLIV